jgi:uncharacterized protein
MCYDTKDGCTDNPQSQQGMFTLLTTFTVYHSQPERSLPSPSFNLDIYAQYTYNQLMKFQYDSAKAKSNLKKHRVSFADAESVFYDDLAVHIEDPHAEDEDRWLAVGMGSDEIRLISVRRATRREVQDYEERI